MVEGEDFIEVTPPATGAWQHASIHTYDDHRMAMCFSLAAFNPLAPTAVAGKPISVRIDDPRCVGKTFPDYFESMFQVAQTDPDLIPVITVDGPTASGKGTLASALAHRLGYQFLDSGSLYRITALLAIEQRVDLDDAVALEGPGAPGGQRHPRCVLTASTSGRLTATSAMTCVARRWGRRPRASRPCPVCVRPWSSCGRPSAACRAWWPMAATWAAVIFPDAALKVFLTATAAERAERRHRQLIQKGFSANLEEICADLEARDLRDRTRAVSPLVPAADARKLDNPPSPLKNRWTQCRVGGWKAGLT